MAIADPTIADTADLVALDKRNFPSGDWFHRQLWTRILGQQATRGEMLTLVARQDNQLVGAVVGRFRHTRAEVVVWSIAVDERVRGTGLSRMLLAELVRRTPPSYRSMTLETRSDNLRARRFYERLGFGQVRQIRGGYADGTDAICYTVDLDYLRRTLLARADVTSPCATAICPSTTT